MSSPSDDIVYPILSSSNFEKYRKKATESGTPCMAYDFSTISMLLKITGIAKVVKWKDGSMTAAHLTERTWNGFSSSKCMAVNDDNVDNIVYIVIDKHIFPISRSVFEVAFYVC